MEFLHVSLMSACMSLEDVTSLSKICLVNIQFRPSQGPVEDSLHSHAMMQREPQPSLTRRIDGVADAALKSCCESPTEKTPCGRGSKDIFSVNER